MEFLIVSSWPPKSLVGQRVLRVASLGLWQAEMKDTTHFHPVSMLRMCGTV